MAYFGTRNVVEMADAFASFLPPGKAFEAARIESNVYGLAYLPLSLPATLGTPAPPNMRLLIKGLSAELVRLTDALNEMLESRLDFLAGSALEQWESALGIPDEVYSVESYTREERARNVFAKMAEPLIHTPDDIVWFASLFDQTVEVEFGVDKVTFPITLPAPMFSGPVTIGLTSITSSGTTATVTTSAAHGLSDGQAVTIYGVAEANYNGTFAATVTGADTFEYTMPGSASSPATIGSAVLYYNSITEARFSVLVRYLSGTSGSVLPALLPFVVGSGARTIFEKALRRAIPANTQLLTY